MIEHRAGRPPEQPGRESAGRQRPGPAVGEDEIDHGSTTTFATTARCRWDSISKMPSRSAVNAKTAGFPGPTVLLDVVAMEMDVVLLAHPTDDDAHVVALRDLHGRGAADRLAVLDLDHGVGLRAF